MEIDVDAVMGAVGNNAAGAAICGDGEDNEEEAEVEVEGG